VTDPRPDDRLDSWKEIAAYLKKDVTTVQRWERREGMPVHRHVHDKMGSVYAFRSELEGWSRTRNVAAAAEPSRPQKSGQRPALWALALLGAAVAIAVTLWRLNRTGTSAEDVLAGARFQKLTDFGGTQQAAALSRDGRFVTFVSDRDGRMDVWVSQIGTGQFHNLTRGSAPELVNPSVRTLGFSPDGSAVTFWARRPAEGGRSDISIWAVPVLGGTPRPYLEGVAEFDWSSDGSRLVYHTPGPGDPMFVRERDQAPRKIFSAAPGLHAHFPIWSKDQSFIYFVQGVVPDRMDIWRIRPSGDEAERITSHNSRVSHPVFLNSRTLLYLASDADGSGPSLYSIDIEKRTPRRMSRGIERYTSLAASADGRSAVVTMSSPGGALWRLPLNERQSASQPKRVSLTTGNGFAPRLGPGFLLYVSSRGESHSIWKLQGETSTEVWSAPEARIVGAPAIEHATGRVAFVAERKGQTSLYVTNADGTDARTVTSSPPLQGAPAWAPDGQSVTVASMVNGTPRLFSVPIAGGAPKALVAEHSVDPVWSADGRLLVYSGADIGTTFPVKAIASDGGAHPLPKLTLSRGSRHLAFMSGRRSLVMLRGEIEHKDLWLVDLDTGAEQQLTHFPADFIVRDFDISPDGRELVVEQVQEHSDIVLIQLSDR